ncbi:MAG: hypothetical protein GXX85_16645 [Ignavibacteria bacterium]|nr:hypothetical protein [Ignavibacteria bacterium]
MNTSIKLALVFIILLMVGCGKKEPAKFQLTKGTVIIEGKVSNSKNSSDLIQFMGNDITYKIIQHTRIDSLGHFRKEIEICHPQDLRVLYLNGSATIYVEPGDSLFIEMDANLFEKIDSLYYNITGSNAETSNNMRDFLKYFKPDFDFDNFNKPVGEFLESVKNNLSLEISLLKEFQKTHKTTEDFINWAYKYITYGNTNSLYIYSAIKKRDNIKIEGDLFDKKLFPVNDDSSIMISTYRSHLLCYVQEKYIFGDSLNRDLIEQNKYKESKTRIISQLNQNEESGLSRDYMIYLLMISVDLSDDFVSLFENNKTIIQSQVLLDDLFKRKADFEKSKNNKEIIDNNQSETTANFWKDLKTKHKNEVIYIDIFATWCGSCRFDIPHAQDLHKYFEGKPVVFVYLCLDSERENWEKIISLNELKGDNYFLDKNESTIFRNDLNFSGYPTYMIMDKKGNLINKNAPRPSQKKEITELLNNLIKE